MTENENYAYQDGYQTALSFIREQVLLLITDENRNSMNRVLLQINSAKHQKRELDKIAEAALKEND